MKHVVGMFDNRSDAEGAIRRLQAAGFRDEAIGVVMRDTREAGEVASATGTADLSAEGATAGVVSGAGVGALIGLAIAGTTLLIPGVGPIIAGGALASALGASVPVAASLAGAGIGAASGGLLGALVGLGIPEDEAKGYSDRLDQGHILVSVEAGDSETTTARGILQDAGASTSQGTV